MENKMPNAVVVQNGSKGTNGASTALEAAIAIQAPAGQLAVVLPATATASPAMPTYEQLAAMLAEVTKQLAVASKPKVAGAIEFRITDKGGVSVYGMGRFPVTLYQEQWGKLVGTSNDDPGAVNDLRTFLTENRSKLSTKPVKEKK
jgi:hypothetical protein